MSDRGQRPQSDDIDQTGTGRPTSYGGRTGIEPRRPGESLGRVPDPDDARVDEAGDSAEGRGEVEQGSARTVAGGTPGRVDELGGSHAERSGGGS
jgi:hypothetical protein